MLKISVFAKIIPLFKINNMDTKKNIASLDHIAYVRSAVCILSLSLVCLEGCDCVFAMVNNNCE